MIWSVEAWRGAAALLVVWAHWAVPLGFEPNYGRYAFVGVDLFFVLSGFVFAPSLFGGVGPLLPYAVRRATRMLPAYWVALAVYVALAAAAGKPLLYLPQHVVLAHLQSREMAFYYNPAFWSLPAELEYYALLPVLAWVCARWGPRGFAAMLAAAIALRLGLMAAADAQSQNLAYLALHHLPGLILEFFLGAWAWHWGRTTNQSRRRLAAALGATLAVATVWAYPVLEHWAGGHDWKNGQLGAVTGAAFALWLAGTAHATPVWGWLRDVGWWAGRLSYGVYLLHMAWLPWLVVLRSAVGAWLALALGLVLLILSAEGLHRLVEAPARAWGRRWAAAWIRQKTSVSPG